MTRLTYDLRTTDPRLEARSLRVGALTTLASNGVPEEQMLLFSGHQSTDMLREYVSHTNIVVDRAQRMRNVARLLISGQH